MRNLILGSLYGVIWIVLWDTDVSFNLMKEVEGSDGDLLNRIRVSERKIVI